MEIRGRDSAGCSLLYSVQCTVLYYSVKYLQITADLWEVCMRVRACACLCGGGVCACVCGEGVT